MNDLAPSVRIEGIDASLTGTSLTFNVEEDDAAGTADVSVAAIYVTLTPHQAEQLRSFFLNHHGEERERRERGEDPPPLWLMRARPQAAASAETAQYVADQLPREDPRKARAAKAAELIGGVSESLHDEYEEHRDG